MPSNPFLAKDREKRRERLESAASAASSSSTKKGSGAASSEVDATADWYGDADDSDHEHEAGFRMLVGDDLKKVVPSQAADSQTRGSVIKNLIDFSECDVAAEEEFHSADEPEDVEEASHPEPQLPTYYGLPEATQSLGMPQMSLPEMHAEIQHLRQRISDVKEESSIQTDILRDEVREQQRTAEDLARGNAELADTLRSADGRVLRLQQGAEAQPQDQADLDPVGEIQAEIARLRLVAEKLRAGAPATTEASELIGELLQLQDGTLELLGAGHTQESHESCSDLEAGLRSLKDGALEVQASAQHTASEHARITKAIQQAVMVGPVGRHPLTLQPEKLPDGFHPPVNEKVIADVSPEQVRAASKRALHAIQEARSTCEQQLNWLNKHLLNSQRRSALLKA